MIEIKITDEQERYLMDEVADKLTRYMLDKRMSEMISVITKQVAEEVKTELTESGKVDEKVDIVVRKIEQSLISRTHKQMGDTFERIKNSPEELSPDAKRMRDTLIATMIGYQNEIGNDTNSEAYKAYQKVLEMIERDYGEFMH